MRESQICSKRIVKGRNCFDGAGTLALQGIIAFATDTLDQV